MTSGASGRWQPGWLVLFLLASFGAAAVGGAVTAPALPTWYGSLRKPTWTPPGWLFGPVWTVLYTLMAVAAWLVQREPRRAPDRARAQRTALSLWWLQLGLNVGWSVAFFGQKRPDWALGVIGLLEVAIVATTVTAARISRLAAALLVPYALWTGFASLLNYRIWQLNRGRTASR